MNVAELIAKYKDIEVVPVQSDTVRVLLISSGCVDEVYFWESGLSAGELRGFLELWSYPDGNGSQKRVADIYYSGTSDLDWQRLVCCKEMVHIIDPPEFRVADMAALHELADRIGLPVEGQDPVQDGARIASDRIAVFHALAILFPYAARHLLMAPFKSGKMSLQDIASIVDLPLRYVAVVMSEVWPQIHSELLEAGKLGNARPSHFE